MANYYIQGDAANADKIKAAFEANGFKFLTGTPPEDKSNYHYTFMTKKGFPGHHDDNIVYCVPRGEWDAQVILNHPDYQELELPVEPKFKVGDRISWKDPDSGDPTDVCRIMQLLDEEQLYMVDKEHGVSYISYASQDYYELAPQFPQFRKGDLVCVEGALLGKLTDDHGKWYEIGGVLYNKKVVTIATQEDIDRIVGKGGIDVTV